MKSAVGPKTITWMTVNHIPESMPPLKLGAFELDVGFGLGFSVATSLGQVRTLKSVGEFGWGGLANTLFWVDRAEQIIGLMMTQHIPVDPYPVADIFHNLVCQAIAE